MYSFLFDFFYLGFNRKQSYLISYAMPSTVVRLCAILMQMYIPAA